MDYLQQIFSEVQLLVPTTGAIIAGVLACVLLIFSGYASGSEIAFFSLSPNDLNDLDEEKNDCDRKIKALREESERTLATILITNNLVNVTIIMLANYFIAHVITFVYYNAFVPVLPLFSLCLDEKKLANTAVFMLIYLCYA